MVRRPRSIESRELDHIIGRLVFIEALAAAAAANKPEHIIMISWIVNKQNTLAADKQ
jgi:hypothetical protein